MRRIDINTLIKRERNRVIIKRRVRARVMNGDGRLGEAGDELGDPADAPRRGGGVPRAV